ncbi:MAG: outer membrane beta-barrel protein [Stenotrophomonas sp.]
MRKTLILAALLAAIPFAAAADELSYTFVEAGWTQVRINDNNLDDPKTNGAYLRGSYNIAKNVNVFGGYSRMSESFNLGYGARAKYTLDMPELGIGYHMNLSDRVDFTTDIAWVRVGTKEELSGFGAYDGSYKEHTNAGRITAGIRAKPSPRTEAWLKGGVIDGSRMDTEFVGTLGGQVNFNQTWGLVGEIQLFDDVSQYSVGVRASF